MLSERDVAAVLDTDGDLFIVEVKANDPRSIPTECIVIGGPADTRTLADLEALPVQLRAECGWGLGYEEELTKRGGGIGAEGATVVSLVLGVVGTVPTIKMLFDLLHCHVPECPDRKEALETATWAIAMQYASVQRRQLEVTREVRDRDHWTFSLRMPGSSDDFEVDVFGGRSGTVATRVVWTNGNAWGGAPGKPRSM